MTDILQDQYHYTTTWYSNLSLERVKMKDNIPYHTTLSIPLMCLHEKVEEIGKQGVTLIQVPYWWDTASERHFN